MDLRGIRIWGSGAALKVELRMAKVSALWNPPNGFDHVLFVIGIFLLTSKWRSIVAQVSTFTVAHSITLALTMYGIVSLPAKVVEPMIALSIAYVAIENLVVSELKPWRLAMIW